MSEFQKPDQSSAEPQTSLQQTKHLKQIKNQASLLFVFKSLDHYLNQFVQPLTPWLDKLVEPLDPLLAKLTIYGLLISSVSLTTIVTCNLIDRYVWVHQLTLAAGKEDGESYKLSKAMKTVVERHYWNIKINLEQTGGTEENLDELKTKKADLATAQADVVAEKNDQSVRTVAMLYKDYFQLIVNKKAFEITANDSPQEAFLKFIRDLQKHANSKKSIEVPEQGGQRISFKNIAKHYGIQEGKNFIFTEIKAQDVKQEVKQEKEALKQGTISAVFRVRALGNQDISELLSESDMELLPIEQTAAMSAEHPALQPNVEIPEGTYQGEPAIPSQKLQTIAVQRLLLTREDAPEQIIQEITEILNEHRKEIAEIAQQNSDHEIMPLTTSIGEPEPTSAEVSIHSGASNFYRRKEPPFIQQYLNIIALVISIGSFSASVIWKLNIRLKKEKKNRADLHIEKAVKLMKPEIELDKLFMSHRQLEQTFHEASDDLRAEKISQESFRTFNEAYKTSREFIERTIEEQQRKLSAQYIKQVMDLLDKKESADMLLRELDGILMQAKQLLQENIFSRESFRTFVESYNVVRDSLKRKKEEQANQTSINI